MRLKYPLKDRQRLFDLCMEENEYQFFLGVKKRGDILEYTGIPILVEGEKYHGNGEAYTEAYMKRHVLKEQDIYLLDGHTHPIPEGRDIPPAYAGWTIGRTKKLRDYRDTRLLKMPGGKEYLKWRRARIMEYILILDWHSIERTMIRNELFQRGMEFSEANLIERNGIWFTITNRIWGSNENISEDITVKSESYGGDTAAYLSTRALLEGVPVVPCAVLAKPRRDAVNTPSSRDKFEIIAMKYNPKVFASFERMDIIE